MISEDDNVLEMLLTLHDPVMFRAPWVWRKIWRRIPDVEILEHGCYTISGQHGDMEDEI